MSHSQVTRRHFCRLLPCTCGVILPLAGFAANPDLAAIGVPRSRFDGQILINDKPASKHSQIRAGDMLKNESDASGTIAIGSDLLALKPNSIIVVDGAAKPHFRLTGLEILSGAVLAIFGKSGHQLTTPHVRIGIRGTGVYIEVSSAESYICNCYGSVELTTLGKHSDTEILQDSVHAARRIVVRDHSEDWTIKPAPMRGHTDSELNYLQNRVLGW